MVVLLILAILLAIAIPTFLGVTKSANDRAAQSNLNTAFVNAKAAFQQNSQTYAASATLVASLISAEPSLSFIAARHSADHRTRRRALSAFTCRLTATPSSWPSCPRARATAGTWSTTPRVTCCCVDRSVVVEYRCLHCDDGPDQRPVPATASGRTLRWTAVNCHAGSFPPTGVAANVRSRARVDSQRCSRNP